MSTELARIDVGPQELIDALVEAVRDPAVDAVKLGNLHALYKQVQADHAENLYWDAMMACQEAMEPIRKDAKNPETHSKYAKVSTVQKIIQPIYREHGFAISWTGEEDQDASVVRLIAVVAHKSGHRQKYRLQGSIDDKGPKGGGTKTPIQGTMSSSSYLRRKLYELIFDLILVDDDDDGNLGKRKATITPEQQDNIATLLEQINYTVGSKEREGFLQWVTNISGADTKISNLSEIPAFKYDAIITQLNAKARKS